MKFSDIFHGQAADNTDELIQKYINQVHDQREEILRAFVAKYGFQPDQCEQVFDGNRWFVRKKVDEHVRMFDAGWVARGELKKGGNVAEVHSYYQKELTEALEKNHG